MTVTVPFDLCHEFEVKASAAEVFAVLADVPASASHFPRVDKLVDLGGNSWRWELQKAGSEQLNIQTIYASTYAADRKKLTVRWTPLQGIGNALIGGSWSLTRRKHSTRLRLSLQGRVSVPLPALMTRVVAPLVAREHDKLVREYIDNLGRRFGGRL